ncbi:hypothetical protein [Neobacillus mesonae]|uniref:hypothetical protein n=1 Tax=Neobacillus mesonae TaxID=1193713 RepID=UPI000FD7E63D|nr:hypothetical protein [Neobacillus mesonae]
MFVRPNESAILLFCTKKQILSAAIQASLLASQSYCKGRIMMLSQPSYMIDEMMILMTGEYVCDKTIMGKGCNKGKQHQNF